jgi:hypothetical protein
LEPFGSMLARRARASERRCAGRRRGRVRCGSVAAWSVPSRRERPRAGKTIVQLFDRSQSGHYRTGQMPVNSDRSVGWTKRSAAVTVLLAMEEHRKRAGLRLVQLREAAGVEPGRPSPRVRSVRQDDQPVRERSARRPTQHAESQLAAALGVDEADIVGDPPAPLGLGDATARRSARPHRAAARRTQRAPGTTRRAGSDAGTQGCGAADRDRRPARTAAAWSTRGRIRRFIGGRPWTRTK